MFNVRAEDQSELSVFQTYCRTHDLSVELTQLHSVSPLENDREYNLTADQLTALELGYTRGYFDSPRDATQQDLDISRQAVSALLQRSIRQLVASTLGSS